MSLDNATVENLANNSNATPVGIDISTVETNVRDVVGSELAGDPKIVGIGFALAAAWILWRAQASMDTWVAFLTPTVSFMAFSGFLPFGRAVQFSVIILIAAVAGFGLVKYIQR